MFDKLTTLTTEVAKSGILTITLNNPDRLNCLNQTCLEELHRCLQTAKSESDITGVIITGSGKAFCAGADIKELAELTTASSHAFARRGQLTFNALEELGKPSIAAVNGVAFGGGCELALAATLRVASHNAKFALPEVKLGVIPGFGGTQRLARLIGKGRALEMCLTGHPIDAEHALSFGLANQLCQADELIPKSRALLESILENAPLALAGAMAAIHEGFNLSMKDALQLEATHFGLCCGSKDKQEGVNAFLEKRPAKFSGH